MNFNLKFDIKNNVNSYHLLNKWWKEEGFKKIFKIYILYLFKYN